jgi:hypothetical protein
LPTEGRKSPKVSGRIRKYSRFVETIGGDQFDHHCRPTVALCMCWISRPIVRIGFCCLDCHEPIRSSNPLRSAQQVTDITRGNVASSFLARLPRVSGRKCPSCPLRERIPCALPVQCRSFLRTPFCQWLSLPMMLTHATTNREIIADTRNARSVGALVSW